MSEIEIISTVNVEKTADLYKIVDVCNRTLKGQNLMFSPALDKKDKSKMTFTIYRT